MQQPKKEYDNQIIDNIIEKSKVSPEGFFSKLWNIMSMPLKIIDILAGLPFNKKYDETPDVIKEEGLIRQNVPFSVNGYVGCNMKLALHDTKTPPQDRKLVIVVSPAPPNTKEKWNGNPDICHVYMPENVLGRYKKYTNASVSAIGRMLQAGYKPENISVVGFCAGAAAAAKAVKKAHKQYLQKDQKFGEYVSLNAAKSLYSIADKSEKNDQIFVEEGEVEPMTDLKKWPKLAKFLIWLGDIGVSVSEKDFQTLPAKNIVVQNNEKDYIVPMQNSISKLTKNIKKIRHIDDDTLFVGSTHEHPIKNIHRRKSIVWGEEVAKKNEEKQNEIQRQ